MRPCYTTRTHLKRKENVRGALRELTSHYCYGFVLGTRSRDRYPMFKTPVKMPQTCPVLHPRQLRLLQVPRDMPLAWPWLRLDHLACPSGLASPP